MRTYHFLAVVLLGLGHIYGAIVPSVYDGNLSISRGYKMMTEKSTMGSGITKKKEEKDRSLSSLIALLLDLLVLLLLFIGAFWGYKKGVLANLVLVVCCGSPFYIAKVVLDGAIMRFIRRKLPSLSELAPALAFLVVLVLSFVIFMMISRVLHMVFRKTVLVHIDNVVGALCYLFFMVLLLSGLLFFLEQYDMGIPKQYTDRMYLYVILRDVFGQFLLFLNKNLPHLNAFFAKINLWGGRRA